MNLVALCVRSPVGVAIAVLFLFVGGLVAVTQLPLQLFPSIDRPQISVEAAWRLSSPKEMVANILEPLEGQLSGTPGLTEIDAIARTGYVQINMAFALDADMQTALVEVIARLNRVRNYPADADRPIVRVGASRFDFNQNLTWLFVQTGPDDTRTESDIIRILEDVVKPRLEQIQGVAEAEVLPPLGPEQLQIVLDVPRTAEYGLTLDSIAARAGGGEDVSGGLATVGRRSYGLRGAMRYSPDELNDLVLDWRDGEPVRLGDVADISYGRGQALGYFFQNNHPAFALRVERTPGSNVLSSLAEVRRVIAELQENQLSEANLYIDQSFDASVFIKRAIGLLAGNLVAGIILAIGILWLFLRRMRATMLIGGAIPICLVTTFLLLQFTGRTLNVISLAGLAFAVGMVLDNAIIVLENIIRHREGGSPPDESAEWGAREVVGPLLASTATTVAIFVPVIFMRGIEGQLFADLAMTIAVGVSLSLLIAVLVLPTAAKQLMSHLDVEESNSVFRAQLARGVMSLTATPTRRWVWIGGLAVGGVALTLILRPPLNYLPPVKRDAVDVFLNMPPGTALEHARDEIAPVIIDRLAPYLLGDKEPKLRNYNIMLFQGGGLISARVENRPELPKMVDIMRDEVLVGLPDIVAFPSIGDLFGGFSDTGSVQLHLQSADLEGLASAASLGFSLLQEKLPGASISPDPNPQLTQPELRLLPNDRMLSEVGWSRRDAGSIVRVMGSGQYVGEYFDGDRSRMTVVKSQDWATPEALAASPLATPTGRITPVGELFDVTRTIGPGSIKRFNGRQTITLRIAPPDGVSLQHVVEQIRREVDPEIRAAMPSDGTILYAGSADGLNRAIKSLGANFAGAIFLLFVLLAGLFRSPKDAALVILALPLATVGGIVALRTLNLFAFQPLDLLTMIGFVILLGLVVNNGILLVHQTRVGERNGLSRSVAVEEALLLRLRPIFMSTATSLAGMAPMVFLPSIASAIYRGLATVIFGGMLVSAIFTLILLPALLRIGETRQTPAVEGRWAPKAAE